MVYIIFLIFAQNIDCEYPQNIDCDYPQSNLLSKKLEKITIFHLINVIFTAIKITLYCTSMLRYALSHVIRKPDFAYAKTKAQISCAVTAQLISAFVFAT